VAALLPPPIAEAMETQRHVLSRIPNNA